MIMVTNLGGQQPGQAGPGPLAARSAAEAQLYLDLHGCQGCGAARPRGSQELRDDGDGALVSVYAGICPGCGQPWSEAFAIPASPAGAGRIGGAAPSAIIDPGEWLFLSDQAAGIPVAGELAGPGDSARLTLAAAAAEEAAKFIPPGEDRVPDRAFTSSLGRAMHAADPGRFRKADLNDRAQLYRVGACQGGVRLAPLPN
jgi:hypothetical protein